MDYFPLALSLRGRRCVVVGGGPVAARKVGTLLRYGARVTVVAPQVCDALGAIDFTHVSSRFAAEHLDDCALVVAATGERRCNDRVHRAARARNIPVNVVDDPALSTFIVPALVERPPLAIAITSEGASPTLVRLLRERLETLLPQRLGELAGLAGRARERVKRLIPEAGARRRFWERVLEGPVAELVLERRLPQARLALDEILQRAAEEGPRRRRSAPRRGRAG